MSQSPRVFVSYSHDSEAHRERIGMLVEELRGQGFDATWDEREWVHVTGTVTNWMRREVVRAEIVLMVFTETYSRRYQGLEQPGVGMGGTFEGTLCAQLLLETLADNRKFLPIVFSREDSKHLPPELRNLPYAIPDGDSGFAELLQRLKAWIGFLPPPGPPEFAPGSAQALGRPWHPPRPPDRFIGRVEKVGEVAAALVPGWRVAIVGAGGMGKTALASVAIAEKSGGPDEPGPWTAGLCSHDYYAEPSHLRALAVLATQLGGGELPEAQRKDFIRSRLDRPDALLYLEGCEKAEQLDTLLRLLPAATILLTSRDRQHGVGAHPIELAAMPSNDAGELLFHHAHAGAQPWPPVDRDSWQSVATRLGGHPLALRLAGQHLWRGKENIEDLRGLMGTVGFIGFDVQRSEKENLGWLFLHSATAVEAAHPGALAAWFVLSLPALAPVPLAPIAKSLGVDDAAACAALRVLVAHSLVEVEQMPAEVIGRTERGWRLTHALLGDWGRAEIPIKSLDQRTDHPWWRRRLRDAFLWRLKIRWEYFSIRWEWRRWWFGFIKSACAAGCVPGGPPRYAALLPHLNALLAGVEHDDGEDSQFGGFLNAVGQLQQCQGDLLSAESLMRRGVQITARVRGAEHPITMESLNALAGVLQSKGDVSEAESLIRRVLEVRERTLGAVHPDAIRTANNLAIVLKDKGDLSGAEPLMRRVVAFMEQSLGAEHPNTLASIHNLGALLAVKGDLSESERLIRRALETEERVLGAEHPRTLHSLYLSSGSAQQKRGPECGRAADASGAGSLRTNSRRGASRHVLRRFQSCRYINRERRLDTRQGVAPASLGRVEQDFAGRASKDSDGASGFGDFGDSSRRRKARDGGPASVPPRAAAPPRA